MDALARRRAGRLLLEVGGTLSKLHTARVANAMAFDLFLAMIPMLAFAGWATDVVLHASSGTLSVLSAVLRLAPDDVQALFDHNFGRFSGAVAPLALLGSLWLASSAFHTMMNVFEGTAPSRARAWYEKRALGFVCVLSAIFAVALSGAIELLIAGGPHALLGLLHEDRIDPDGSRGRQIVGVGAAVGVGVCWLAAFFRVAVRRPWVRRRVWPGALLAIGIGGVASWGFAEYARTLARFAVFYGGLAAVAIVMAWVWLWCGALLVGATLNTQLEDRDDPVGAASERAEALLHRKVHDAETSRR